MRGTRRGEPDVDALVAMVQDVARTIVLPRHTALEVGDVVEKAPGDLVTVADHEAEAALTERLGELLPGVPVLGEEAAAADPAIVNRLVALDRCWVVDPIDGTGNFVDGSDDFATMVALLEHGRPVLTVIHQPAHGRTFTAALGAGAYEDGQRLQRAPADANAATLRGIARTSYLPVEHRARVEAAAARFPGVVPASGCCGINYPAIATDALDFVVYWRTLPWDHAPGSLLVTEAGAVANRYDGVPYEPRDRGRGLVVAADVATFTRVRDGLTLDAI